MLSDFTINTQAAKFYEKMKEKLLQKETKKQRPEAKIKEEMAQR